MNFLVFVVVLFNLITSTYSQKSSIQLTSSENQLYFPSTKTHKRFNLDVILVLNNLENKTIPLEVRKTLRVVQRTLEGIIDKDLPLSFNYTAPCRSNPLTLLNKTSTVDDLLVFVIPSNTTSFANGGPCYISKDGFPRVGDVGISLNAFEAWRTPPFTQQNLDFFRDVMLHEFFHVLGIGTLWFKNVTPYQAGKQMNYTGTNGVANYKNNLRGSGELEVETHFGDRGSHFDECLYDDEIMSPVASYGNYISSMTCSALQDLKYTINMTRCDSGWKLPRKVPCTSDGFRLFDYSFTIDLHNDTLSDPEIQ